MNEKYYVYKINRNPTLPPELYTVVDSRKKAAEARGRLLCICEFGDEVCITPEALNAEDETLCHNQCALYGGAQCLGWEDCNQ